MTVKLSDKDIRAAVVKWVDRLLGTGSQYRAKTVAHLQQSSPGFFAAEVEVECKPGAAE